MDALSCEYGLSHQCILFLQMRNESVQRYSRFLHYELSPNSNERHLKLLKGLNIAALAFI